MLIKIYPENPNPREIDKVIDVLRDGGLVIYPTDTVYAIGCDALNVRAVEKICQMKKDRPQASTQEIAELVGMERHAVYRILKQSGLYDEQAEKQNKNFKISMSKKRIKDCDIQTICQMKQDHPLLSAREAGRLTGHSHTTILSVWREFGLA